MTSTNTEARSADPVVDEAVNAAMRITEPEPRSPWWRRAWVAFLVLLLGLGTFGTVVSAVNSVNLNDENSRLQETQKCVVNLIDKFQADQGERIKIAARDRKAVDTLARALANARTQAQRDDALDRYEAERRSDEAARARVPATTGIRCGLHLASTRATVVVPTQSSQKVSAGPTPTSVPTSASASGGAATASTAPRSVMSSTRVQAPAPNQCPYSGSVSLSRNQSPQRPGSLRAQCHTRPLAESADHQSWPAAPSKHWAIASTGLTIDSHYVSTHVSEKY